MTSNASPDSELTAVFQPVASLRSGSILGYEGLVRGAENSVWRSPEAIFDERRGALALRRTEMHSMRAVLRAFGNSRLSAKLFLNVAPELLRVDRLPREKIVALLERWQISPSRVVIEVTENQPSLHDPRIYAVLREAKSLGFEVAIDDLGEGYASLRVWSELQPDYVKIAKHFVTGLHTDPVKFQFVRTIRQLSQAVGTKVIGEGVESESELRVLRDLGVEFAQGFFIGEPAKVPATRLDPHVVKLLRPSRVEAAADEGGAHAAMRLGDLAQREEPLEPGATMTAATAAFQANEAAAALPVVVDGVPRGLLTRQAVFAAAGRADAATVDAIASPDFLILDARLTLHEASILLAGRERSRFADAFVVTERGRYRGVADAQRVMQGLSQSQTTAERHANPLTSLPGNAPMQQTLQDLLAQRIPFVACFCDMDHLKAYNSVFGFGRGDNLIKYTAILLEAFCDPRLDFLAQPLGGHFVLLFRSADWEDRCKSLLAQFIAGRGAFLGKEDIKQEGYYRKDRRGTPIFHPLPTLSIGAVRVEPGKFASHHQVLEATYAATQEAKKARRGGLFVERRSPDNGFRESIDAG